MDAASFCPMRAPNTLKSRREFLEAAGIGLATIAAWPADGLTSESAEIIIDTHTHFYDPKRSQGVPWPPKDDPVLYRTVMPSDYVNLPKPAKVHGTVVVEASPWVEDNQWILDLAAREPFIVGLVGNLPVGTREFPELLERFGANRLFRGVRVQGGTLGKNLAQREFMEHLELLARAGLALDVVGSPDMLAHVAELAGDLPELRIVIDHVGGVRIDGKEPPMEWRRGILEVAQHRYVFCKVSGLVEGTGRMGGRAPTDLEFYRPVLDALWDAFGEDRLLYGSNWPVCEHFGSLATVQRLVSDYFESKGGRARAKLFSGNASVVYRWIRRDNARKR